MLIGEDAFSEFKYDKHLSFRMALEIFGVEYVKNALNCKKIYKAEEVSPNYQT
jgi:hypothetical protein